MYKTKVLCLPCFISKLEMFTLIRLMFSGVQPTIRRNRITLSCSLPSETILEKERPCWPTVFLFFFFHIRGVFFLPSRDQCAERRLYITAGVEEEVFASKKIPGPCFGHLYRYTSTTGRSRFLCRAKSKPLTCSISAFLVYGFYLGSALWQTGWVFSTGFSPLIEGGGVYGRKQPRLRFSVV